MSQDDKPIRLDAIYGYEPLRYSTVIITVEAAWPKWRIKLHDIKEATIYILQMSIPWALLATLIALRK